jgi:hypothetical protein
MVRLELSPGSLTRAARERWSRNRNAPQNSGLGSGSGFDISGTLPTPPDCTEGYSGETALRFAKGAAIQWPNQSGILPMPRRIVLGFFAIALTTMPVRAADLPVHSRLGAVFAEPSEAALGYRGYDTPVVVVAPVLAIRPLPGYYGRPNSFYYSPYYDSSVGDWAFRLPYACSFYGYC